MKRFGSPFLIVIGIIVGMVLVYSCGGGGGGSSAGAAGTNSAAKGFYDGLDKAVTSPTGEQIHSLQVNVPAAGNVIVTASGVLCIAEHEYGSKDSIYVKISKTSTDMNFATGFPTGKRVPATANDYGANSYCDPFSIQGVFNEASAGNVTYYLNGMVDLNSTSPTAKVSAISITAVYVPGNL